MNWREIVWDVREMIVHLSNNLSLSFHLFISAVRLCCSTSHTRSCCFCCGAMINEDYELDEERGGEELLSSHLISERTQASLDETTRQGFEPNKSSSHLIPTFRKFSGYVSHEIRFLLDSKWDGKRKKSEKRYSQEEQKECGPSWTRAR